MRTKTLLALALAASTAGCFSTFPGAYSPLQMTYNTDPPGAMVYQGETFLGYGPTTVSYGWQLAARDPVQCMRLQPITAPWASGAEAIRTDLQACARDSYLQQRALVRPANVPGRDLDVQFAIHLQETAATEAQAAAVERAALFQALAQQSALAPRPSAVLCSSQVAKGNVYTACQ
jgi:hypothetical protein